jgi:hypothetical protein
MDIAALVLWVVTALGGFTMAGIWLANRGPAQHAEGVSRITPGRLGAHFGLAATGLVLWIVYVASDNKAPGWAAFALLPIVAVIGFLMFMTWLAGRGAVVERVVPAEQKIPRIVVAAHGLFAVLTVIVVFIAVVT